MTIDVRTRVERLLETLTAFGRSQESELFRLRFERSNWQLREEDLTALQAALTHGLIEGQTSPPPAAVVSTHIPSSAKRGTSNHADLPAWLEPLSQHTAYIQELDKGSPGASISLLERVNGLLAATSYSQFYEATRELFVEELRFDDLRGIDELPRLPSLHSFTAIRRVATYDQLPVFAVEDRYGGPHPNLYNPLFQLSHRCIVLAFHPALQRSRIVFRGHDTVARYRTLVGRVAERESLETLVTLARRFSALRPNGLESGRDLEKRARRVFAQRVEVLVEDWSPGLVDETPRGAPWRTLISKEAATFISRQTSPKGYRLHLGLEAAFRNRFPIPVAAGAGRLRLIDWEIVDAPGRDAERWSLIAARSTRSVIVRLRLQAIPRGEPVSDSYIFEIDTELPLPDDSGELIIDGTPGQLCFHLDEDGDEYLIEDEWREPTLELDDDIAVSLDPSSSDHLLDLLDGAPPSGSAEPEAEDPAGDLYTASRGRDRNRPPRTCSLNVLWTFLVERRLAALALCLWRSPTIPTTASEFLSVTRAIRPRGREFPLVALGHLWRHVRHSRTLERVAYPVVRMNRDAPPAWACLEAARHDPEGHWVPIASARLHPDGRLAIPVREGAHWRLSLCTASPHEAQGRWNETFADSDPRCWLCDALQWFTGAVAGSIEWPLRLLQSSQTVRGHCVVSDRFRILVTQSFLAGLRRETITSMRVCDVPAPVRTFRATPPTLLVETGARAGGGQAWLSVPSQAWTTSPAEHIVAEAYRRLTDSIEAPSLSVNIHLGPDEHGVVSSASLVEHRNPSGRVDAWRAAVQLRPARVRWVASLQDGRAIEVEVVGREDMPFNANGAPLDICVLDPLFPDADSGVFVFAPDTGELVGEASEVSIMLGAVCPWAEACPPDVHLRYRTLDGEGLPADGSSPQLSDDWRTWLAAAEPEQALLCDAAEQGMNAGVSPALPHLQDLAAAVRSSPLPLGPDVWRTADSDGQALYPSPFDPTTPRAGRPGRPPVPQRFEYRCACAALCGQKYTSLRCAKCNARVALTPVKPVAQFASAEALPEPSIHPWRKAAVAALCGLSTDELDIILQDFSGQEVCQQILQLDGFPAELSFARLAREECTAELRAEIEGNCEALQQSLRAAGNLEEFLRRAIVTEVREPMTLERLSGRPPGSSELQAPSVLLKLRHVRAASTAHALLGDMADAACATRLALNRSLDQLFGAHAPERGAGELESFRAWLHRLLPPARLASKTHVLPGLFRSMGDHKRYIEELRCFGVTEDVLRDAELRERIETDAPPDVLSAKLHLATRGTVVLLQRPDRIVSARDPSSWRAQWAYRSLYSRYQLRLASLAAATELLSFSELEWASSQWPAHVDRGLVGQVVLRQLWHELRLPASQPSGLLSLLCNPEHLELPADASDAEQRVTQRLQVSLPSRTGLGDFVRMALARVLCGWSRDDVADYRGVSVQWSPRRERAATRFLPGDDSFAWKVLPGSAPLLSPERWLLDGPFDGLSPVVHQLMRWGNYPVAPRWESHAAESPPEPSITEAEFRLPVREVPQPPVPPQHDQVQPDSSDPTSSISVYEDSIRAWLS